MEAVVEVDVDEEVHGGGKVVVIPANLGYYDRGMVVIPANLEFYDRGVVVIPANLG